MKRVSVVFKDRPMSPMNTAVYWIEYVIRHKGAPELRSAATGLPLYQYLLLDVISVILVFLFAALFILARIFTIFLRIITSNRRQNKCDTKKTK